MTSRARVRDALATVDDPELDEPITSLDFVASCEVSADGDVDVRLRLPTPRCRAELRVPDGRRRTCCRAAAARGRPRHRRRGEAFAQALPGQTEGDLRALRELFHRKASVARQSRLCEALLALVRLPSRSPRRRVAELPDDPNARRCIELRGHLGIARDDAAAAFVLLSGEPITADGLRHWLRIAKPVRTSLEANGGICRSLLSIRFDLPQTEEVAA